jgi:5-methylcytosine-specific restriction endonuclease McrA
MQRPRVGMQAPRLKRVTDAEGHGPTVEPWRKWYHVAEWERVRQVVFERDRHTCQMADCGVLVFGRLRIADHVRPHRGDRTLFFDPKNVQTLCKPCHDKVKQAEERAARG